jgi:hypothetical protein
MVLSAKTLIMIAMSNPPLHFLFLQSHLPLNLEDVAIAIRRRLWMQHDGAPHATREVTALLNEHFVERGLGRSGPCHGHLGHLTYLRVGLHEIQGVLERKARHTRAADAKNT